jgi:signal transduction histidine kinase
MGRHDENSAENRSRTPQRLASILVFAGIGIGLTTIFAFETFQLEQKAVRADFLALAEHRAEVCSQAICEGEEIIAALALLYEASNEVSRDEFGMFAQSYVSHFDGIRCLAWIPAIPASARAPYELAARRDGLERFQIVQKDNEGRLVRAPERARYMPLFFVEPYAGNAGLLGLDLATDRDAATLLQDSCDTGRTCVAMLPPRVDANETSLYMNIFSPVYDWAGITFTVTGRRENLRGYVFGVFDLKRVVEEALQMLRNVDTHIHLWHEAGGHRQLLHYLGAPMGPSEASTHDILAGPNRPLTYQRRIPISQGELVIECTSTPGFMKAYGRRGYRWVLLGGLLLTMALTAYIRMHLTRTTEVERQVSERTRALAREVREREEAESQLRKAQRKLVEAAHRAGMADVATDVLHNVGNVLNSINVATARMIDLVVHSKVSSLARVMALIGEHRGDLGTFLIEDERGKQVPVFLAEVSRRLDAEQSELAEMLDGLAKNVQHIKDTITMQQSYAKVGGMEEQVAVTEIIEDAIQINKAGLDRHGVRLVREYEDLPPIQVNKQKVLQVLVNLLSNGKYALSQCKQEDKVLTVRLRAQGDSAVRVDVIDNGVGIAAENLNRIFRHGFTTKKEGHGFGLHSGALAAKEMGGTLSVHSDGLDKGAAFTLVLPMKRAKGTTCETTTT